MNHPRERDSCADSAAGSAHSMASRAITVPGHPYSSARATRSTARAGSTSASSCTASRSAGPSPTCRATSRRSAESSAINAAASDRPRARSTAVRGRSSRGPPRRSREPPVVPTTRGSGCRRARGQVRRGRRGVRPRARGPRGVQPVDDACRLLGRHRTGRRDQERGPDPEDVAGPPVLGVSPGGGREQHPAVRYEQGAGGARGAQPSRRDAGAYGLSAQGRAGTEQRHELVGRGPGGRGGRHVPTLATPGPCRVRRPQPRARSSRTCSKRRSWCEFTTFQAGTRGTEGVLR